MVPFALALAQLRPTYLSNGAIYLLSLLAGLFAQFKAFGPMALLLLGQTLSFYGLFLQVPRTIDGGNKVNPVLLRYAAALQAFFVLVFLVLQPSTPAQVVPCLALAFAAQLMKTWSVLFALRNGVAQPRELTDEERKLSLVHVPTALEFAAYVHFGGTALTSTFFEYKDFVDWAEGRGRYSTVPWGKKASLKAALERMAHGLLCLAIYVVAEYYLEFDVGFLGSREYITFGDDAWVPFWKRIGIFQTAMSTLRLLYYATWCFADASLIACGLSYDGSYKETPNNELHYRWYGIQNINIIDLEFARSPITMLKHWDISAKVWIRRHFLPNLSFLKIPLTAVPRNLLATLLLSFLHNFDLLSSLLFAIQLTGFCHLSHSFMQSKEFFSHPIVPFLLNYPTLLFMNFLAAQRHSQSVAGGFWTARSTFGAAVNEHRYFLLFVGGAALWQGAGVTDRLVGKGATGAQTEQKATPMTPAELKEKKDK